jgi:DNA adenine methylase
MFFARAPERALLTDINASLIETYETVRDEPGNVLANLRPLERKHGADEYYRVRARYNARRSGRVAHAAMFIYLNKTCFNGLHRVNRDGEFNVPAGRYVNPRIVDEQAILRASRVLARADLSCSGFEVLVEKARPGDFIYFDPPYEPVSTTANFTSYTSGSFGPSDQEELAGVYATLDSMGCRVMLSNSDTPFIRDLYRRFDVRTVLARRAINSKAERRGPVREVVVLNYEPQALEAAVSRAVSRRARRV